MRECVNHTRQLLPHALRRRGVAQIAPGIHFVAELSQRASFAASMMKEFRFDNASTSPSIAVDPDRMTRL